MSDMVHTEAPPEGSRVKRLTVCGLPWPTPESEGPLCAVCHPAEAHPMAAVWRMCRRFDANYNAGLAR